MRAIITVLALTLIAAPAAGDETTVRVDILRHQFQTVISSEGGLTVRPPDAAAGSPYVAPDLTTVLDVRPSGTGLLLAGAILTGPTLVIGPAADFPLSVNGHAYRGSAIVQANDDGTLDIINVADLEQYLYGVVGSEMEPSWPAAALQAQAIVARTYAVAHLGTREWLGYDLLAGEQDQAYKGMQSETPEVDRAVDATRGTILVYASQVVHAYYSSCDGGYASGGEAFDDPQPYLQAVADPFCTISPDERWTATVPLEAFTRAFEATYGSIGAITAVAPGPADESGRLRTVDVVGSIATRSIPATSFRALAGTHLIRSTRIDSLSVESAVIRVSGSGFGHGVGMAQWGARAMADRGASARDILGFYYRGAEFAQIAGTLAR